MYCKNPESRYASPHRKEGNVDTPDTDHETSPKAPVILVDDSLMDTTIARRVYERSKLDNPLLVFHNGNDLLRYLDGVESGDKPRPALVFLDVHLEGKTGVETLSAVRSRHRFRSRPNIIMLTNEDDPQVAEASLAQGADGYQLKPAKPPDFIRFFNSLEELVE
ncbi:MAG: response regulator [Opitutales bacterium]